MISAHKIQPLTSFLPHFACVMFGRSSFCLFVPRVPPLRLSWAKHSCLFWPSEHVRGRESGSRSGRKNICSAEERREEPALALTTGCATFSVTLPSWSIPTGLLLLV